MAIFHADDVYSPTIVERYVETFMRYPRVGGLFTLGNIIDDNDTVIGTFRLPHVVKSGKPYGYYQLLPLILEFTNFLPTPGAMIRTELYKQLAPFNYDMFRSAADLDLWLRLSKRALVVVLDEPLLNYRVGSTQGTNVMNRLRTRESDFFTVMDVHRHGHTIPLHVMNSYELLRFGDGIVCTVNALRKRDWKRFTELLKTIHWTEALKISLRHPGLLYAKVRLFMYFKVFRK
jgi:hypothetical protein